MSELNQTMLLFPLVAMAALIGLGLVWQLRRRYNLHGKTVLITGGSRGLGLLLARELAREGAYIAICARDPAELERAQADLSQRGADVFARPCDVTDPAQVNEMVRAVSDRFGPIDVLINNAGIIQVGPLAVMTLEDYEVAMKTHFWASLYTTFAVLPAMRQRRSGRIVNISSIGGKVSAPHLSPYSASKFALTGFSQGLRAELLQDKIFVTTVCPGLIRTGSPRHAIMKGQHRAEYAWFSLSDSLPFTSMSAERAARQIIAACKQGKAEVVLSLQAQIATKFHGLFPGLTADLLGIVNRWLPEADGIGSESAEGKDSTSDLSPSALTALSDSAAERNNEIAASEPKQD